MKEPAINMCRQTGKIIRTYLKKGFLMKISKIIIGVILLKVNPGKASEN